MRILRLLTFVFVYALPLLSLFSADNISLGEGTEKGLFALAAGLAIALAALGGGLAQGRAAAAAMEGTARNPEASKRIFILLILALALIESLVIYALVVAFSLIGKI